MAFPCSRSRVTVQTCSEPSGRLKATVRSGAEGDGITSEPPPSPKEIAELVWFSY